MPTDEDLQTLAEEIAESNVPLKVKWLEALGRKDLIPAEPGQPK